MGDAMYDMIIVGAGGFGRELRQLLPACLAESEYRFKGYLGRDQGIWSLHTYMNDKSW